MGRVTGWGLHWGTDARRNVVCQDLSTSCFPIVLLCFRLILSGQISVVRFPSDFPMISVRQDPSVPAGKYPVTLGEHDVHLRLFFSHWRSYRLREAPSLWYGACLGKGWYSQSVAAPLNLLLGSFSLFVVWQKREGFSLFPRF